MRPVMVAVVRYGQKRVEPAAVIVPDRDALLAPTFAL
jgi:hypothetical protein